MVTQPRIETLTDVLEQFVEQDEQRVLVLNASDDDMLYPVAALDGLDRSTQTDVFVTYAHAFVDASAWMDELVVKLAREVETGNRLKAERREAIASGSEQPTIDPTLIIDLEPWPEPPAEVMDSRRPAWARLMATLAYIDSLVPSGGENRLVCALLPVSIADPPAYLQLVAGLITGQGLPACAARHRYIIRDNRLAPFLLPVLERRQDTAVLVHDLDFSPERMHDDLVASVRDRSKPERERVLGVLQLAAVDFSQRRYDDALDKYAAVYDYFDGKDQPGIQALCLSGAGDVAARQGDHVTALARHRQALALVAPTQQPALMLNPMLAAGKAALALRDFAEAEAYLGNAADLAGKTLNYTARCDALLDKGVAQREAGKLAEALATWTAGNTLAASFGFVEGQRHHLEAMTALYEQAGMSAEAQRCRAELRSI